VLVGVAGNSNTWGIKMHRIVIVGGGAGGLELATQLGRKLGRSGRAKVTLVDARMTHLWKPLLHEVASGALDAAESELNYLAQASWNHFQFQLGRMTGLDQKSRKIELAPLYDEEGNVIAPRRSISYDTLVISVGSGTNDFGTPGAADHCLFLDDPDAAIAFQKRLLSEYMGAQARGKSETLEVAIVGAGATGVELAAELRDAARQFSAYGLDKISPENLKITLIEAGPRVLPALPERVSLPVAERLVHEGVRVMCGSAVTLVDEEGLQLANGIKVAARLKVWAAGIRAPVFLASLGNLKTNRINQLEVSETLQTTQDPKIFAFGDCAACPNGHSGTNVPPRAQAAHQQAHFLALAIARRIEGRPLPSFTYRDYGSLVSLSREGAVGTLMGNLMGSFKVEGWLARMFYISLYRMHQRSLFGTRRVVARMLADALGRSTEPRLKLH
jgi:NADH:ubiquinone reductase (H+-translocating)